MVIVCSVKLQLSVTNMVTSLCSAQMYKGSIIAWDNNSLQLQRPRNLLRKTTSVGLRLEFTELKCRNMEI